MLKRLIGTGLVAFLSAGSAHAANCSAYTYALTNGTSADASQVMSNFNNILNCSNSNLAPIANPSFTGNVGIGTVPAKILDALGSINGNLDVRLKNNNSGSANQARFIFESTATGSGNTFEVGVLGSGNTQLSGGANAGIVWNENNAPLLFAANNAERMRITASGNVGIGTIAPALLLNVNGSAGGTSAYQVVSDGRLKKNIETVSSGLSLVDQLRPVRFDWREVNERSVGKNLNLDTSKHQIGFIAQEVEKIVPEAVTKPGTDADATYTLKEDNLIPVLVAAIKEQQAEIEQLRASVAALTPATQH